MRVPGGGGGLRVAKEFSNDWQAKAAAGSKTGVRVAQVVNAKALEIGYTADQIPRPLEVGTGLVQLRASDNVLADAVETVQGHERRRIEHDRLFAGLDVRQEQQPAVKVDVLPLQMQDFPKPRASE